MLSLSGCMKIVTDGLDDKRVAYRSEIIGSARCRVRTNSAMNLHGEERGIHFVYDDSMEIEYAILTVGYQQLQVTEFIPTQERLTKAVEWLAYQRQLSL